MEGTPGSGLCLRTPLEMRAGVPQWPETKKRKPIRISDLEIQNCLAHTPIMFSGRKRLAPSVKGRCVPAWIPRDCGEGVGRALLSGTLLLCTKADHNKSCNSKPKAAHTLSIASKTLFSSGGVGRVHTFSRIKGFFGLHLWKNLNRHVA